jgi:hypothetical protein
MKRLSVAIALCGLAGAGLAGSEAQLQRKTLDQSKQIQSYECAKGYAWFYADGKLKSCTLTHDTDFGVARAPAGSWITLDEDGRPKLLQLNHDTPILGYKCRGGNRILGPGEGATTAFYPSGKLEECWLAEDQDVQGIPCAHSGMFTGDSSVKFYESGKVKSCSLAKDYRGQRRGEKFAQAE